MSNARVFLLGAWLMLGLVACRPSQEADQKWLKTVEKVVLSGHTRILTKSSRQVELLKKWANQRGYGVGVTKLPVGYRIELMACAKPAAGQPASTNLLAPRSLPAKSPLSRRDKVASHP